jgi:hypothetical protein
LYENDTASDVRDAWLKKIRQGASGEVATKELPEEWNGAHDEPLFWLALADTQWTWGRLEAHVRENPSACSRPMPISRSGRNRRIALAGYAPSARGLLAAGAQGPPIRAAQHPAARAEKT